MRSDAPRLGGARVAMPNNQLTQTTAPGLLLEREAELAALEAMLGAAQRATVGWLSSRAAPESGRRGC